MIPKQARTKPEPEPDTTNVAVARADDMPISYAGVDYDTYYALMTRGERGQVLRGHIKPFTREVPVPQDRSAGGVTCRCAA